MNDLVLQPSKNGNWVRIALDGVLEAGSFVSADAEWRRTVAERYPNEMLQLATKRPER